MDTDQSASPHVAGPSDVARGAAADKGGTGTAGPQVAAGRRPGWRARARARLDVIRANTTGRIILKVTVAVVGALVVALGIALIPLPGPGWALVILGLAIWAIEFVWAKHLLRFTRRNVQKWSRWVGRQSWPVRLTLGAAGLVFVATVVWVSVKISFDVDLMDMARNYLAAR
jgi:uncharacterized protein (TIGR02611 family)